jgi:hypothetical protein
MRAALLSLLALIPTTALVVASCERPQPRAADVTYTNTIGPLTAERCWKCHGEGSPTLAEFDKDVEGWKKKNRGPRMDSYERLTGFVNGEDAGAVMRRLDDGTNTRDGQPGNMYVNLGDSDAERAANLALFKQWVGEAGWILKNNEEWTEAERKAVHVPR